MGYFKRRREERRKRRQAEREFDERIREAMDPMRWYRDEILRRSAAAAAAAEAARQARERLYNDFYQTYGQQSYGNPGTGTQEPPRATSGPSEHHRILGVPGSATAAEIKTAYRKLAMKHHPDRGGDAAEFRKITTAYESLTK